MDNYDDFWIKFPDNENTGEWHQILDEKMEKYKKVEILSFTRPQVLEWDLKVSNGNINNMYILCIIDCIDDPISDNNKFFNVEQLCKKERHVGIKKLIQ